MNDIRIIDAIFGKEAGETDLTQFYLKGRFMKVWNRVPILVVVGVFLFLCGNVLAQTQPPPAGGGRDSQPQLDPRMEKGIEMMFQDMDTNKDGKISKKEWMAAQERQFDRLDKNKDGSITKEEVKSDMMDRMRQAPPPQGGRGPQ